MANDRWKLRKEEGKVYGPVDTETMREWIQEGRISPEDYLSREDKEEWVKAKSLPQFQGLFVPAAKATPPPPGVVQQAESLKCPQCEQIDKVAKVTAIVASGTSTGSYSGPTVGGGVGVSLRGGVGVGGGYAHTTLSGGEQTNLAAKLSPPAKPTEFYFFGAFGFIAVTVSLVGLITGAALPLIGRIGYFVLLLLGVVCVGFSALWEVPSYQEEVKKWKEDTARWEKSYYCARCDMVFIP